MAIKPIYPPDNFWERVRQSAGHYREIPKSWHVIKHWYDTAPGCIEYYAVFTSGLDINESICLYDEYDETQYTDAEWEDESEPIVLYPGDYEVIADGLTELQALNIISLGVPAEINIYFSFPCVD